MTGLLLTIAAVLVVWAGIAALRRSAENTRAPSPESRTPDDDIDRDALEQAEREVKDLDVTIKPEDGFEGDDWGPGAAKRQR